MQQLKIIRPIVNAKDTANKTILSTNVKKNKN